MGDSIDAHNTFENPNAVKPEVLAVSLDGGDFTARLPPRSVSVVRLRP
jgi:alpha-L-arabinofuranosidase